MAAPSFHIGMAMLAIHASFNIGYSFLHPPFDCYSNAIDVAKHICVCKAQDREARNFEFGLPLRIFCRGFGGVVGDAVHFDDEHEFLAEEVGDVVEDGALAAEGIAHHAARAKGVLPEAGFGFGHRVAQAVGEGLERFVVGEVVGRVGEGHGDKVENVWMRAGLRGRASSTPGQRRLGCQMACARAKATPASGGYPRSPTSVKSNNPAGCKNGITTTSVVTARGYPPRAGVAFGERGPVCGVGAVGRGWTRRGLCAWPSHAEGEPSDGTKAEVSDTTAAGRED